MEVSRGKKNYTTVKETDADEKTIVIKDPKGKVSRRPRGAICDTHDCVGLAYSWAAEGFWLSTVCQSPTWAMRAAYGIKRENVCSVGLKREVQY